MNQSNDNTEEVVLRLKEAMHAERIRTGQMGSQDITEGIASNTMPDKLRELDVEIRSNNLKWNIVTEWAITSHRKTIGRFIVYGKKIARKLLRWYINPPLEQQREFNGSVTRSLNIISEWLHIFTGEIEKNKATVSELTKHLETAQNDNRRLEELLEVYQRESQDTIHRLAQIEEDFLKAGTKFRAKTIELEKQVTNAEAALKVLSQEFNIAKDRLRRIERKLSADRDIPANTATIEQQAKGNENTHINIDYFHFEQRFRGDREEIKQKQKIYLGYFKGKKRIIDVGCGRGEFVELMMEHGAQITGIDINEDMVEDCLDRGLPVLKADMFEYLEALEDNSLEGIFIAQVIEHLPSVLLVKLIDLAYSKLSSGGVLLMETINPESMLAISNAFYVDPSHVKPVHPLTAHFLMESKGFNNISLIYSNPIEDARIPELILPVDVNKSVDDFNKAIGKLNNILYGPRDYAVIGTK